jgi:Flp pilus assembly protein TadG
MIAFQQRQQPKQRDRRTRRGVATVELAIVLMVFLTIIFGMMELSIAVFRYHVTSQAARQAARIAIVHGEFAPPEQTTWGPSQFGPTTLDTDSEIPNAVRRYITGLDPAQTTLTLEWPDGNSRVESKVRATVQTQYSPFITFLFTSDFTLTAQSTMQIAH